MIGTARLRRESGPIFAAAALSAGCLAVCAAVASPAAKDAAVPATPARQSALYPNGYPAWTHVKSGLIETGHPAHATFGRLHHIYANDAAIEGFRNGRFPDGAVLVYDLFEVRPDGHGIVDQGPRRHIDVMVRDDRRYAETGGWGYAEFAAGTRSDRLTGKRRAECVACHATQTGHDQVFSRWQNLEPQTPGGDAPQS